MTKRIKNRKQAAALRAGVVNGRYEGLNVEKSGGLMHPFGYMTLPSAQACVYVDGKWRYLEFDLFSRAWQKSFDKAFESRFTGLSDEARKTMYDRIIHECGLRTGRIEPMTFTFEDGSKAVAYRNRW